MTVLKSEVVRCQQKIVSDIPDMGPASIKAWLLMVESMMGGTSRQLVLLVLAECNICGAGQQTK